MWVVGSNLEGGGSGQCEMWLDLSISRRYWGFGRYGRRKINRWYALENMIAILGKASARVHDR